MNVELWTVSYVETDSALMSSGLSSVYVMPAMRWQWMEEHVWVNISDSLKLKNRTDHKPNNV